MTDKPVALITGTSRGIGLDLAKRMVLNGYRVFGCSRGEGPPLSGAYTHHVVDLQDEKSVRAWVKAVAKETKRIDVAINNAGVGSSSPAILTPLKLAESVSQINYLGTFLVCREAAKVMLKRKFGRIINFASVATAIHMPGAAAYAASKAAVIEYSKVLAREIADANITVNVVAPSLADTDMYNELSDAAVETYRQALTLKRNCTMDEIGNVVSFLASEDSSALTGQVLYLGIVV